MDTAERDDCCAHVVVCYRASVAFERGRTTVNGSSPRHRERRHAARPGPPSSLSKSALVALHDRMNRLEQLCYAQVRRINALEAELDYLRARRQEGSR